MSAEKRLDNTTSSPRQFIGFTRRFLREKKLATVVEIGPDRNLRVANALHKACKRYIAIGQETEIGRAYSHQSMRASRDLDDVQLITGNAVHLSRYVQRADAIILHNVLLTLTETDAQNLYAHNTGKRPLSETALRSLIQRLESTKFLAYRECLNVANPGYVLSFNREQLSSSLSSLFTQTLGVNPANIEQVPLLYDKGMDNEAWELVIVDNTQSV